MVFGAADLQQHEPVMNLPPALLPLRNAVFRRMWLAFVVTSLGVWLQNTGAGWLMTTLSPDPLTVSLVQAATILPMCLLAVPAGAIADIFDRRLFLLITQGWTMAAAALLAVLTLMGAITVWSLLGLTFAIGIGTAMTAPAWGSLAPELVPREDLVQAIALNGIGFNLARAIGPALGGILVLVGGSGLTFALYAVSFTAVLTALLTWKRVAATSSLPREHFLSAVRAGMRFVRNTPPMRAAMIRSFAYSVPAAAPWAMLPLVVHSQLGLGAGMYGLILGMMGMGGVTGGMLLPNLRGRVSRSTTVFGASVLSCGGIGLLAVSTHWIPACLGMMLFGMGWVTAYSSIQAAAQLVAPPWVRARALAIYQLSYNGALTAGSFGWGWLGAHIGLTNSLLTAAAGGLIVAGMVRGFGLDGSSAQGTTSRFAQQPMPEAPAAELAPSLPQTRRRILETMHYRVDRSQRRAFLEVMSEIRQVRGRAGAVDWQLFEDVAHPEGWVETWMMDSWTDHLREATRLSDHDKLVLDRASLYRGTGLPPPARYISVDPETHPDWTGQATTSN